MYIWPTSLRIVQSSFYDKSMKQNSDAFIKEGRNRFGIIKAVKFFRALG